MDASERALPEREGEAIWGEPRAQRWEWRQLLPWRALGDHAIPGELRQTLFKGDGEATTQSAFPARRSESQGRLNSQRERETRTKKEGKRERGERRTDVDGKMRKNAFIMFSQRSFNGRPEICAQRAGDE